MPQTSQIHIIVPLAATGSFHTYTHAHTYTHIHPFNGPLSGTTRVSRYQKGKTNLDFTEARDSEWQWHQQGHMQVCTSLQTDNHASTPLLCFTGRVLFLPPNQQCYSTEIKQYQCNTKKVIFGLRRIYIILGNTSVPPPSGTLFRTLDVGSFATARRSPQSVVNFARWCCIRPVR